MAIITLFTDAGFCPHSKVATYAAWTKYEGATYRKSGYFKSDVPSAADAELRAMGNGIAFVTLAVPYKKGDRLILQTDCQRVIQFMLGKAYTKYSQRNRFGDAGKVIRKVVEKLGCPIEYRHVPAHQGTVDKRSSVNTWCDEECRRLMNIARVEKGFVVNRYGRLVLDDNGPVRKIT